MDSSIPHSAYVSTRWYRAPECLLSTGFYGPKMDIWAIGCCFYEMLTLIPLFPGDNELDQLEKIHGVLGSPSEKLLDKFKMKCEKFVKFSFKFPKKKAVGLHNMVPMLSDHGLNLLNKMLGYHPDSRITVKRMLDHIYFADLKKKSQVQIRVSASASKLERTSLILGTPLMSSNQSIASGNSKVSKFSRNSGDNANIIGKKCGNLKNNSKFSWKNGESVSRDSTFSRKSIKNETVKTLKQVQSLLNKDLERAWGMNSCNSKNLIFAKVKKSNCSKMSIGK